MGSEILDDLEPELAQKLLLRATYLTKSRWIEKEKAAMAVVKILGSYTLAIIQAGAFVRQKLCTLEEYPTLFQQQKGQLLKFQSKQNLSTYGNVYATFEVSAEHLQKSKLKRQDLKRQELERQELKRQEQERQELERQDLKRQKQKKQESKK